MQVSGDRLHPPWRHWWQQAQGELGRALGASCLGGLELGQSGQRERTASWDFRRCFFPKSGKVCVYVCVGGGGVAGGEKDLQCCLSWYSLINAKEKLQPFCEGDKAFVFYASES